MSRGDVLTLLLLVIHNSSAGSLGEKMKNHWSSTRRATTTVRGLPNKKQWLTHRDMASLVQADRLRGGNLADSRYFRLIPLLTATCISGFAVHEIIETLHEYQIGHAHGIASLGVVKVLYALGELQEQVSEADEVLEHEGLELGHKRRIVAKFRSALVGRKVSMVACIFALFACGVEIFRDLRPGGHHGAALLVGSELVNQFYRLRPADMHHVQRRRIATMAIAIPAALFAASELVNDLKPGAHHGKFLASSM